MDALTAEGGAPAAADPARHQRAVLLLELLTRVGFGFRTGGLWVYLEVRARLPSWQRLQLCRGPQSCSRGPMASSAASCGVCIWATAALMLTGSGAGFSPCSHDTGMD